MRKEGDSYARVLVRFEEIKQSMRIIRDLLDKMPNGAILNERFFRLIPPALRDTIKKTGAMKLPAVFTNLRPPKSEAVSRVEAGRGELVHYIISDGTANPYRFRLVTPSIRNVIIFKYVMPGHRFADIPAIFGSLDYFPPEADR